MTRRRLFPIGCAASLLSLFLAASSQTGFAQATGTAQTQARIQVFGLLSYVDPKYGGATTNAGATFGAEFNVGSFRGGQFEPGLEARALGSNGNVTRQYDYVFGPRLQYNRHALHPYAGFYMGYGRLRYKHPYVTLTGLYAGDDALTYNYNAGLDYSLTRTWAVRADYLLQHWNISPSQGTITPWALSLGLQYRFGFRSPAY